MTTHRQHLEEGTRDAYRWYDDWLDDVYCLVDICGYKYDASHAFKVIDPVAYRCGFNDWADSELENMKEEDDDDQA